MFVRTQGGLVTLCLSVDLSVDLSVCTLHFAPMVLLLTMNYGSELPAITIPLATEASINLTLDLTGLSISVCTPIDLLSVINREDKDYGQKSVRFKLLLTCCSMASCETALPRLICTSALYSLVHKIQPEYITSHGMQLH